MDTDFKLLNSKCQYYMKLLQIIKDRINDTFYHS